MNHCSSQVNLTHTATQLVFHGDGKHLFKPYFKRLGVCSQLITLNVVNNSVRSVPRFPIVRSVPRFPIVRSVPRFLENKQINNHQTTIVCFLMIPTLQIQVSTEFIIRRKSYRDNALSGGKCKWDMPKFDRL